MAPGLLVWDVVLSPRHLLQPHAPGSCAPGFNEGCLMATGVSPGCSHLLQIQQRPERFLPCAQLTFHDRLLKQASALLCGATIVIPTNEIFEFIFYPFVVQLDRYILVLFFFFDWQYLMNLEDYLSVL